MSRLGRIAGIGCAHLARLARFMAASVEHDFQCSDGISNGSMRMAGGNLLMRCEAAGKAIKRRGAVQDLRRICVADGGVQRRFEHAKFDGCWVCRGIHAAFPLRTVPIWFQAESKLAM